MENLNFDTALYEIYDETKEIDIDPFIYFTRHFDLLKNQIDIFAQKRKINDEKYLKLIETIQDHEKECHEKFLQISTIFSEKLKSILVQLNEINKKTSKTKDFVEKKLSIRKEWIETRKLIFSKNLIFFEHFEGRFVIIEPLCLDDQQINLIKLNFFYFALAIKSLHF